MNKNLNKFRLGLEKISTANLYLALIGDIDADFVSLEYYINRGEYAFYYSVVKKEEGNNFYDIMLDLEYSFRDESKPKTILELLPLKKDDKLISAYKLQKIVDESNQNIKDKPGDNKPYARTRKSNLF